MSPELECPRVRRFLRFPGGCYVEGDVLKGAFRWKQSIGPSDERRGHWNLWGYWSTDGALGLRCLCPTINQVPPQLLQLLPKHPGVAMRCAGLGLFEYMQLAEEVGAAAVWVINSGVSHRQSVAPSDLGAWLQARRCIFPFSPLYGPLLGVLHPAIRRCEKGVPVPTQALLRVSFDKVDDEVRTQRHSTTNHM